MVRDESIIKEIYNGKNVVFPGSKNVISCFAAYMEKYCKDFKYSSRYLVSHLEEFEKSIRINKAFEKECSNFKKVILSNKHLNTLLFDIKNNKKSIDFHVVINDSITFRTKSLTENDVMQMNLDDVLNQKFLDSVNSGDIGSLTIKLFTQYEDLQIVDYVYEAKTNTNYIDIVYSYLNKLFLQILTDNDAREYIDHLIALVKYIPKKYKIKINFMNNLMFHFDKFDNLSNMVSTGCLKLVSEYSNSDIVMTINSEGIEQKYFLGDINDLDKSLFDFKGLIDSKGGNDE